MGLQQRGHRRATGRMGARVGPGEQCPPDRALPGPPRLARGARGRARATHAVRRGAAASDALRPAGRARHRRPELASADRRRDSSAGSRGAALVLAVEFRIHARNRGRGSGGERRLLRQQRHERSYSGALAGMGRETTVIRRVAAAAAVVAWFLYFTWDGLRVPFGADEMMNLADHWRQGLWRL